MRARSTRTRRRRRWWRRFARGGADRAEPLSGSQAPGSGPRARRARGRVAVAGGPVVVLALQGGRAVSVALVAGLGHALDRRASRRVVLPDDPVALVALQRVR